MDQKYPPHFSFDFKYYLKAIADYPAEKLFYDDLLLVLKFASYSTTVTIH